MNTVLAFIFLFIIFYLFIQFGREEEIQDVYNDIISDVEGRLEWARTRNSFPFGMKAQLEVSCRYLRRAKSLWKKNKWHQAYRVVLQAQKAMNRAQNIYSSTFADRRFRDDGKKVKEK